MLDAIIDQLPGLRGLTPTSLFLIHVKCNHAAWLADGLFLQLFRVPGFTLC